MEMKETQETNALSLPPGLPSVLEPILGGLPNSWAWAPVWHSPPALLQAREHVFCVQRSALKSLCTFQLIPHSTALAPSIATVEVGRQGRKWATDSKRVRVMAQGSYGRLGSPPPIRQTAYGLR